MTNPAEGGGAVNYNCLTDPAYKTAVERTYATRKATLQDYCLGASFWFDPNFYPDQLLSIVMTPVFDNFHDHPNGRRLYLVPMTQLVRSCS